MSSLCIYKSHGITFGPSNFVKILSYYISFSSKNSLLECAKTKKLMFIGENCSILIALVRKIQGKTTIHRLDGRRLIKVKNKQIKSLFINKNYTKLLLYIVIELRVFIVAMLATKLIFQSEYIKSQWPSFLKKKSIVLINPGNIKLNFFKIKEIYQRKSEKEYCKLIYSKGYIGESKLFEIISKKNFFNEFFLDIYSNNANLISPNKSINFCNPVAYKKYLDKLPNYDAFICLEDYPPCPNAVIEAQLCGLPIIALQQGSIPEIVVDKTFLLPNNYLMLSSKKQKKILREKILKVINMKKVNIENIAKLSYEKFCKNASKAYIEFLT